MRGILCALCGICSARCDMCSAAGDRCSIHSRSSVIGPHGIHGVCNIRSSCGRRAARRRAPSRFVYALGAARLCDRLRGAEPAAVRAAHAEALLLRLAGLSPAALVLPLALLDEVEGLEQLRPRGSGRARLRGLRGDAAGDAPPVLREQPARLAAPAAQRQPHAPEDRQKRRERHGRRPVHGGADEDLPHRAGELPALLLSQLLERQPLQRAEQVRGPRARRAGAGAERREERRLVQPRDQRAQLRQRQRQRQEVRLKVTAAQRRERAPRVRRGRRRGRVAKCVRSLRRGCRGPRGQAAAVPAGAPAERRRRLVRAAREPRRTERPGGAERRAALVAAACVRELADQRRRQRDVMAEAADVVHGAERPVAGPPKVRVPDRCVRYVHPFDPPRKRRGAGADLSDVRRGSASTRGHAVVARREEA